MIRSTPDLDVSDSEDAPLGAVLDHDLDMIEDCHHHCSHWDTMGYCCDCTEAKGPYPHATNPS